jgi:hypothetical protein
MKTADWNLPKSISNGEKVCVLLTIGSLNPIHKGHVHMMNRAKTSLENQGWTVWAGFVSPSHELYLQSKQLRGRLGPLDVASAEHRLAMAELAIKEHPWLKVGRWETTVSGYWPDYPEVIEYLLFTVQKVDARISVFYVCGTDHALHNPNGIGIPKTGWVVVPREGDVIPDHTSEEMVVYLEPDQSSEAFYSSTKVRTLLREQDTSSQNELITMLGQNVFQYMIEHRLFV